MKSRLLIILLIVGFNVFAQVPNTTTFTLQDVVNEVNPTTNDLQDCFNDAIADYFNPTYEGSKNSLLNFRDYGLQFGYVNNGGVACNTSTTLSISYPSNTTVGDVIILAIYVRATDILSGSYKTPSGWTLIGSTLDIGFDTSFRFYSKKITSTPPTSLSVSCNYTTVTSHCGIMYRYEAGSLNIDNALVDSYMLSPSTPTSHTVPTGAIGVNIGMTYGGSNPVTASGDYSIDSDIIDGRRWIATSGNGDGTAQTTSYTFSDYLLYMLSGVYLTDPLDVPVVTTGSVTSSTSQRVVVSNNSYTNPSSGTFNYKRVQLSSSSSFSTILNSNTVYVPASSPWDAAEMSIDIAGTTIYYRALVSLGGVIYYGNIKSYTAPVRTQYKAWTLSQYPNGTYEVWYAEDAIDVGTQFYNSSTTNNKVVANGQRYVEKAAIPGLFTDITLTNGEVTDIF